MTEKLELPKTRRDFEKWLRGHGFSKRLSVRLASAWPSSEQEAEEEAMARIRSLLKVDK